MSVTSKYAPPHQFKLNERTWPSNAITSAPIWCSVDLRDGNQALANPMSLAQKIDFFDYLVHIGFKEIEVGFPAAAQVEYDFLRTIISTNRIPDDVTIQVLTQARPHVIEKTVAAIDGCHSAIIHLYNSTSVAQRKYVFQSSKQDIIDIALNGVSCITQCLGNRTDGITLQYSPESFTGTEIDFSIDICNQVIRKWGHSPIIINLPATVELFSPNVYADMIEYASTSLLHRETVILSLHTHNDRGTGQAASELGLLAGAQRIEGTLFGNGERTGNLDITTMALNMLSHGIDPTLDLSDIPTMIDTYKRCTLMDIDPRHPYAGELVFTAFSGSHQDAIHKGLTQYNKETPWDIPYLTIDPNDIGREYQAIIRINSQSGKGGLAYIMKTVHNCIIPKAMQPELSQCIQIAAEKQGTEVDAQTIWTIFKTHFVNRSTIMSPTKISTQLSDGDVHIQLLVTYQSNAYELTNVGNGPIDASKNALEQIIDPIIIHDYSEHSLGKGSDSMAICYMQVEHNQKTCFGVGLHSNITLASIHALFSAINRCLERTIP